MTLNMDVVAPIPRAIDTVATDEKPRCLRKDRNAKRRSLSSSSILDTIPDGKRMCEPPHCPEAVEGSGHRPHGICSQGCLKKSLSEVILEQPIQPPAPISFSISY